MNVNLSVAVYQERIHDQLVWHTVSLGPHDLRLVGRSEVKLQRKLIRKLQKLLADLDRSDLVWFHVPRGQRLLRVRAELVLTGGLARRRLTGRFPLVCQPRAVSDEARRLVLFHPKQTSRWFSPKDEDSLEDEASLFLRHLWKEQDEDTIRSYESDGKDRLLTLSFNASITSLPDELKKNDDKRRADQRMRSGPVLAKIGSDETQRAVEGTLPLGVPREPYRRQLGRLLGARRRQSTVVLGPAQVGKSTLIHRAIADLLDAEDFPTHKNLDDVTHVWAVSGKRVIAGMSYLGDWEQRCLDLLEESKKKRAVLWFDDLHLFGQLGRTRQSDRSLASFFVGPVQSGELTLLGECTPEQWQRLEDDAPGFAALFSRVRVEPTSSAETMTMMVSEARELEQREPVSFHPFIYRTIVELSSSLFPWSAFPGKAMTMLRSLAEGSKTDDPHERVSLTPREVVALASRQTGMPESMLTLDEPLDVEALERGFRGRVMGQDQAVDVAARLTFRIRAGLTDPKRPYAVMLFTGPTGTGKTEMARSIAEYLFGGGERLLRFDMSEYATPDAVARLIGDRWSPEGQLTTRIREQPFSVLLLDEIEKAHRSVLYLLLQLFDEARLTDAAGNTASFHQTVVVMTSNLGAKPTRPIGFGGSTKGILADIDKAVRDFFPPELFNRIDEVVPFTPLTEEIAEAIAVKELASLLSRRGLRERNIFVYAGRTVKQRIVAEAFDPRHGARTVKRYLEDRIGSLLADEVSRQGRASMQVVRIYEAEGDYRLHPDPLVEVEPASLGLPLEPLLDLPALALRERIDEHLGLLEELDLVRIGDEARNRFAREELPAPLRYWLDHYLTRVVELQEWLRERVGRVTSLRPELLEAQLFSHEISYASGAPQRHRVYDRRAASETMHPATRDELLAAFAEARFLARGQRFLTDPAAHGVELELLRVGERAESRFVRGQRTLLERLLAAHASPDQLEALAWRSDDGRRHRTERLDLDALAAAPPVQVVVQLGGFGIRDRVAVEEGCHIWRSAASEPEIVRVRVLEAEEGGEQDPTRWLTRHLEARQRFEVALDDGQAPLPANPEALSPAVRTYAFRPPLEEGRHPFPIEVEDFRLAQAASLHVRKLDDVIRRFAWLWQAREEAR